MAQCYEKHGKCTVSVFRGDDEFPCPTTVMKQFGSWNNAKDQVEFRSDHISYPDEILLKSLDKCYERYGICTQTVLDEIVTFPDARFIIDAFGSWEAGIKMSDVPRSQIHITLDRSQHSDSELIEMLRECALERGGCTIENFEKVDKFPPAVAVAVRFGSWDQAKTQADIESIRFKSCRHSNEELLDMLRQCYEKHGKCTAPLMNSDDEFCGSSVYSDRFGSWNQAKEKAGLPRIERAGADQVYDRETLLEMLTKCYEKHGKCIQSLFNDDDEFASAGPVSDRFGSWTEGKQRAKSRYPERWGSEGENTQEKESTQEEEGTSDIEST
jgi:hypothetical protein